MVGVAILLIFSTVALQSWSMTFKRDNEEELIFRGKQIAMAIRMFQKYNGRYPTDIKELYEKTGQGGGAYVLRRPFKDPMTPAGEWGYVYLSPQGGALTSSGIIENQQAVAGEGTTGQETAGNLVTNPAGLPIIGVCSKSDDEPIGPNRWRGGLKYSEWLFTISDLNQGSTVGGPVGGPVPGQPAPGAPGGVGTPGGPPGGSLPPRGNRPGFPSPGLPGPVPTPGRR